MAEHTSQGLFEGTPIPEFPAWIYINYKPYTMMDGVVYTLDMIKNRHTVTFLIFAYDPERRHIFSESFQIEENPAEINRRWEVFKSLLPSLIMENLL